MFFFFMFALSLFKRLKINRCTTSTIKTNPLNNNPFPPSTRTPPFSIGLPAVQRYSTGAIAGMESVKTSLA